MNDSRATALSKEQGTVAPGIFRVVLNQFARIYHLTHLGWRYHAVGSGHLAYCVRQKEGSLVCAVPDQGKKLCFCRHDCML
jgi:hypothetical protein